MSVEISSFRHAIMLLGFKRLKRWLALLLATASKDANMKPVMFAAVRRGLLMEELVRASGDEEMRDEMFICGVFSLLDRMFQQTFATCWQASRCPSACPRRWPTAAARTSRSSSWCTRSRTIRCSTSARPRPRR